MGISKCRRQDNPVYHFEVGIEFGAVSLNRLQGNEPLLTKEADTRNSIEGVFKCQKVFSKSGLFQCVIFSESFFKFLYGKS